MLLIASCPVKFSFAFYCAPGVFGVVPFDFVLFYMCACLVSAAQNNMEPYEQLAFVMLVFCAVFSLFFMDEAIEKPSKLFLLCMLYSSALSFWISFQFTNIYVRTPVRGRVGIHPTQRDFTEISNAMEYVSSLNTIGVILCASLYLYLESNTLSLFDYEKEYLSLIYPFLLSHGIIAKYYHFLAIYKTLDAAVVLNRPPVL